MEAVQLVEAGSLELREVPKPDPGADEVVVRVAGCGVCHTDIGFWKEGVATRKGLPLTLGHEISGVVESAGASFSDLVGREVIVPAVIPCGECELCRNGRGNVCRTQLMPGNDMDGGFADYVQVPGRGLCVVEDRGGYELAELSVIADAVTTPYQAVLRSGLQPGDLAVVVGVGGVGTYAVQIAATFDAKVIAIDVDASKLAAVADHGASLTIDASDMEVKDIRKQVTAAAKEWGSRLHSWKIYECSGNLKGQETAFGLLTHAATLMVVGFTLARGEFRLSNLMAFDATAQGTWGCRPELYPDALKMITDGQIALRPFIETHPLSEGLDVLDRVAAHEVAGRAILVPGLTA
ncbi:MAG: 6-hydroxycyclohex-1-ene-1-carbonyl-CoA dehydrogenase [Gemmatimonadota bacterium]|jgi:6-hydroxycyclohex-1-ene-1-carbonyl-CoA dehydrogenase